MKDFKLPISIKIFIGLLVAGILFSLTTSLYTSFTDIYNQSVSYKLDYTSVDQNQVTSYDNDYLAFKEKSSIADISKETFVTVTEIIMNGRKDGSNLAWKWVHENQNIPYEEFTCFYKELSAFTSVRFEKNAAIERQKQGIAKNHNQLITTFPGVIYNHFLKIQPLTYKEGFISSDTRVLFNK